jgi:hypothetical protein
MYVNLLQILSYLGFLHTAIPGIGMVQLLLQQTVNKVEDPWLNHQIYLDL